MQSNKVAILAGALGEAKKLQRNREVGASSLFSFRTAGLEAPLDISVQHKKMGFKMAKIPSIVLIAVEISMLYALPDFEASHSALRHVNEINHSQAGTVYRTVVQAYFFPCGQCTSLCNESRKQNIRLKAWPVCGFLERAVQMAKKGPNLPNDQILSFLHLEDVFNELNEAVKRTGGDARGTSIAGFPEQVYLASVHKSPSAFYT